MPGLKQVERLWDICITCFKKCLLHYINDIKSFQKISADSLSRHIMYTLLGNIHPFVTDSLLDKIDNDTKLDDFQKLVLIKIYKHSRMKRFNLNFKLPKLKGFYEDYLIGLNNLVVLNLTKVCTDEILEIVGKNCPLLEVIYIISKTESVSNKSGKVLNALKLKFFVSDRGLSFLHNCKYLKKIYMDRIMRSCCGGRKITNKGIRSLLYALPDIRYISYGDMGVVLEGWEYQNSLLNLAHLHDNHVNPTHISLFNCLCPSIQSLCLSIPPVEQDPYLAHVCLQTLTDSNLLIKSLMLKSFPFDFSLEHYLNVRGQNLSTLLLDHEVSITTQCLFAIGIRCKNIEHLTLKSLHPSIADYEILRSSEISRCFTNLKSLKLFGFRWKPDVIFPLCLYNSKQLESLFLLNMSYSEPLDELLIGVSSKNSFSKLSKLCLLDGFCINIKTLINFVLGCKSLSEIAFKADYGYDKFFEELIAQKNLDLEIKIDSNVNYYGECLCQN